MNHRQVDGPSSGLDANVAPFIYLKKRSREITHTGQASFFAGHRLPDGDGTFALWHWDGTCLTANTDRYGFRSLYYFHRADEFAVSSSLLELLKLGAPADLDDAALAVALRLGTFLDSDTPFRSIRALPPGVTLSWNGGPPVLSGSHSIPKLVSISRDEAIDRYVALFATAVARRLTCPGPLVATLSGGRDSRHILLELCRQDRPPDLCATVDFPFANEAEISAQLTKRCGIPHTILPNPPISLDSELRTNLVTNFCLPEHAWMFSLRQYLRGRAESIWDGIGGDVLSAGLFLTPKRLQLAESGRFADLASELLGVQTSDESALLKVFHQNSYRRWHPELALQRVTAELKRFAEAGNPVGAFYFWNRTRRQIASGSYGICAIAADLYSPYLDHALYDFLSSLPAPLLVDHSFHTDAIARAYPAFVDIPYARKTTLSRFDRRHLKRLTIDTARFLWGQRPTELFSYPFVASRLLRSLMDSSYCNTAEWLGPLVIYLLQLDSLSGRRRHQTYTPLTT